MNTMSKILFILSLIAVSFTAGAQKTQPNEVDVDKAKKEISAWAVNQAYLIMGNLLTVCALEEIDACPMEGFEPAAYDKLLGLTGYGISAVLVLPVGYRALDDPFAGFKKVRKKLNESIVEIN